MKPENIDNKKLQDIVDILHEHKQYQTAKFEEYKLSLDLLGSRNGKELKENGFHYHQDCRSSCLRSKVR